MASELKVGALLAVLAASKPGGRLLELGTGTGHGTAWLLSGMDETSHLDTVDTDQAVVQRPGFTSTRLGWASGLMLVVRAVDVWPTRRRR